MKINGITVAAHKRIGLEKNKLNLIGMLIESKVRYLQNAFMESSVSIGPKISGRKLKYFKMIS